MVHKMAQLVVATFCNNWTRLYAEKESRPDVGSSRNSNYRKSDKSRKMIKNKWKDITDGSVIISTPTLVRFRCPPDIPLIKGPPIKTSAQPNIPKSDNTAKLSVWISNNYKWDNVRTSFDKLIYFIGSDSGR